MRRGVPTPPASFRRRMPFYMLGLDLPPPPLFQDVMEKNIIPQARGSASGQRRRRDAGGFWPRPGVCAAGTRVTLSAAPLLRARPRRCRWRRSCSSSTGRASTTRSARRGFPPPSSLLPAHRAPRLPPNQCHCGWQPPGIVFLIAKQGRKTYEITRLPKYLILHMKRFTRVRPPAPTRAHPPFPPPSAPAPRPRRPAARRSRPVRPHFNLARSRPPRPPGARQNNFFVEKNPTIVTFPVKNLELKCAIVSGFGFGGWEGGQGGQEGSAGAPGRERASAPRAGGASPLPRRSAGSAALSRLSCWRARRCPPPQGHHPGAQGEGERGGAVQVRPRREHLPRGCAASRLLAPPPLPRCASLCPSPAPAPAPQACGAAGRRACRLPPLPCAAALSLAHTRPHARAPPGKPGAGSYRAQVLHRADGMWYDMQDLAVTEVLPQQVALAETFVQVYELKGAGVGPERDGAAGGAGGGGWSAAAP